MFVPILQLIIITSRRSVMLPLSYCEFSPCFCFTYTVVSSYDFLFFLYCCVGGTVILRM